MYFQCNFFIINFYNTIMIHWLNLNLVSTSIYTTNLVLISNLNIFPLFSQVNGEKFQGRLIQWSQSLYRQLHNNRGRWFQRSVFPLNTKLKYFYSKFHIILLFVLFDIFCKKFKNSHNAEARFKQTHFCSKKSYNVAG